MRVEFILRVEYSGLKVGTVMFAKLLDAKISAQSLILELRICEERNEYHEPA